MFAAADLASNPPNQHKNDNDDQNDADDADATVSVTVTVAAETAAEAAQQENQEDNDENEPQRHGLYLLCVDTIKPACRGEVCAKLHTWSGPWVAPWAGAAARGETT
jgi:hypothetical protein